MLVTASRYIGGSPHLTFKIREALMHNRTNVRLWYALAVSGLVALGGCRENPLAVTNPNDPDVGLVYGTPKDVETILSKLLQQMWNAQQGNFGIGAQTQVMSFESHSSLANFSMGARANIPRGTISNSLGNSGQNENFSDFDILTRNARSAANAIAAINRFNDAGTTIGSAARDARARSFGFFNLAYGLANVALLYDSAAIITPETPSDEVPPLSGAHEVTAAAIDMLDSALAISASAAATTGAGGWPIPGAWVSGDDITIARWQQILRSFKARFNAGVARNPAQRAAVDWNALVSDATAGITADFVVNADNAGGWESDFIQQLAEDATWSQMTPYILGMADTSGGYEAWLATPRDSRSPFLLRTPDQRFPSGATRTEQQAVTGDSRDGPAPGSILYYRNRPAGEDSPALPWGDWYYDHQRFFAIRLNSGNGPMILLSKAENDMLIAEGYMRTGRTALAVPLINFYRERAGLLPIPPTADQNTPVPGGNACVPQVPTGPSGPTTCGSVFEAMKWEKRLETAFTGYAQWYFDSRGWGDLAQNTVLEWPVPWQELYARINLNLYTTDDADSRAALGTYGF